MSRRISNAPCLAATLVCPSPQCTSKIDCSTGDGSFAGFIAGKDNRLDHKEIYPGVGEIMLGLARGPIAGLEDDPKFHPAKPILLSARPREAQAMLAMGQSSVLNLYLENVGDRLNMTYGANVDQSKYGTLFDGSSFTEMGETKAKSYAEIGKRLPQTRFLFMGDNGQGDVCAAQAMLESDQGDRLAAVLIHQTEEMSQMLQECEDGSRDFTIDLNEGDFEGRVHYHKTHSNAALWLLEKGLISCCSANHVYQAVDEFITCRCDGGDCGTHGLPTGISVKATRSDTLDYCSVMKADQELLKVKTDECPVDCPRLDAFKGFDDEISSQLGPNYWIVVGLPIVLSLICCCACFRRIKKKRYGEGSIESIEGSPINSSSIGGIAKRIEIDGREGV